MSVAFVGLASVAQSAELRVFIDRDNNVGTGCTVSTPGGPFPGVETILITTINTAVYPPIVSSVTRQECAASPSTFTPPSAVDGGGWPVGIGLGVSNFNPIETYVPLTQNVGTLRLGFLYTDGAVGSDVVFTTLSGSPITLVLGIPVPTLPYGTLFLLALALAAVAWLSMRRYRRSSILMLAVVAVLFTTAAWAAIVLDGMITDWAGAPPLAVDAANDAPAGADISAVFGQHEPSQSRVYFRADVWTASPPPLPVPPSSPAPPIASTTLTSSPNPSTVGGAVQFTATVTPPGPGTPTGTVTFKEGATTLGSAAVIGGTTATFSYAGLSVGTHTITATYSGDANFGGSTSAGYVQTVNVASTTTTLTSSPNPSTFGGAVQFTGTVTPSGPGTPTGTVTFKEGATTLGSAAVVGGTTATFSYAGLSAGTHTITATYNGDANFGASTSAGYVQTVVGGFFGQFNGVWTGTGTPTTNTCSFNPATITITLALDSVTGIGTITKQHTFGSPPTTVTVGTFACTATPTGPSSIHITATGTFSTFAVTESLDFFLGPPRTLSGSETFTQASPPCTTIISIGP